LGRFELAYFDNKKNVLDYIKMVEDTEGYDPTLVIDKFKNYVLSGSKVLEIGMGPGKDFDILKQTFKMTGSDSSQVFLEMYLEKDNSAKLIKLDAITLNTNEKFDAIFSNKVLMHLSREELHQSFLRQIEILNSDGIAFHTFWSGDKEEEMHGLRFVYYSIEELCKMIPNKFKVLESSLYKEMEKDDSICIVINKSF
jgi:cyclopropane fatty-acyl-phospholipid synthase-like methyltransferase